MYPQELLPRKCLQHPVLNDESLFVRLLKNFPADCIDDTTSVFFPEIVDEILKPNGYVEVYSLSLFLYGTYLEDHFDIKVKNHVFFDYWDGEEELTEIDFEIVQTPAIFIKSNCLHGQGIYYKDNFYQVKVEHKPTRCNYWHFECATYGNEQENKIPRKKGAMRENIATKIKEDLLYFAVDAAKEKSFKFFKDKGLMTLS